MQWIDASASSYSAESATVNGRTVTVCLDDEGPLYPAFYWDITQDGAKVADGWASTVRKARADAVRAAKTL